MDFSDTDEHRLIRDSVRKVCADFPDEYWAEKDEAHEFPWDFYRAMAAGGWLGIAIPEPYGGSGRGLAEAGIVLEEVAASGAAMNGCSALHMPSASPNRMRAPTPPASLPPPGATETAIWLQRPEVRMTLLAAAPIPKVGRNAIATCEVVYDDLPVPVEDRVGEEGRGFRYLLDGLNAERVLVASEALGIGRAALRRAVDYANERVVFGRPIGKNQGVAFPLGEARMRLDAAELMIRKASWLLDSGQPCGAEANMAKWLAADACYQAADQAVQTHGGFGYAKEFHVERYWREARLQRLAPISQEMVLNYVTEHVLGLPRSY